MAKTLALLGATDKRAISYPLIKVLMHLGRTLIVTDDGLYRRFDEDYNTNFDFENSEFLIIPKLEDEHKELINQKSKSFEYVLYITTNEIPDNASKIVYCRGIDKGLASISTLRQIEDSEFIEVLVTFDKVADKKALKIVPSIKQYKYFSQCEDRKEFLDSADSAFVTLLTTFFEEQLDLPKSTIKSILARKG